MRATRSAPPVILCLLRACSFQENTFVGPNGTETAVGYKNREKLATDKSRYFAQPRPIIANYSLRTLPELPLLTLFYRNVLSAWKSISKHTARTQNEIKNEILWNNHQVTIGGKSVFYKQWYDADVKNILNKEGKFMKLLIFYPSLNAVTNFLCFIGLRNTIPKHWRNVFRRDNENDLVVSDESVHPFKN